ncbi:uncharacterized protein LOC110861606 isoform X2 [Folsomia candida]|uniref:uncharacterized protein LOC110861606 isoform X2 n=1 Tax=Folsomia candida TaxID=158441 RepID=UPI000B8F1637|nr:uncharacterized protein LOC110861606 isoform X2 [Folsomia candida]
MESARKMEQIAQNNPIAIQFNSTAMNSRAPWGTSMVQILTQILQQAYTSLKTCRLVSHFWNDMVLSLPNTRLALRLRKLPLAEDNLFQFDTSEEDDDDEDIDPGPVPFLTLCLTLDARLAKRIWASSSASSRLAPKTKINYFGTKLLHVCDKFSQRVQILEISTHSEDYLPPIYHVLKNCCPNLTQLRIKVTPGTASSNYSISEILFHPLSPKPNLTTVAVTLSNPRNLARFSILPHVTQQVVHSAPNLREIFLPVGFYPDFAISPHLETLAIGQDLFCRTESSNKSAMSIMLAQVSDHLINLSLGKTGIQNIESFEVLLPGMAKLKMFRNMMVDVFRCGDFFKNIAGLMPSLTRIVVGEAFQCSKGVDEILQNLRNSGQIVATVTDLVLIGVHEVTLLDGLETVLPNVAELKVDSLYEARILSGGGGGGRRWGFPWGKCDTEMGAVLAACRGWRGLKHLKLGVSTYPNVEDMIKDLLDNRELFKERLKTLEISLMKCMYYPTHNLTQGEMNLFETLLMEMRDMNEVTILFLYFGAESRKKMLDFMVSNKLEVSKFKMFQGGKTCRDGE